MKKVAVRQATAGDADVVARILRRSFRDVAERFDLTRQNAPTHPSNCEPDWVRSDIARGISYLLLTCQTELAGCVALETASPHLAYLERLGVLPMLRVMVSGHGSFEALSPEPRRHGSPL